MVDNTAGLYKIWCERCYYYTSHASNRQNYAHKTYK